MQVCAAPDTLEQVLSALSSTKLAPYSQGSAAGIARHMDSMLFA